MNAALWIVQILLGLAFVGAGSMLLIKSKSELAANPNMAWANDFSDTQIKLIGLAELLGAIGLILPWLLNILPVLTPLAAAGLAVLQLGAAYTHLRRGELKVIPANLLLIALSAFVAWGRFTGAL